MRRRSSRSRSGSCCLRSARAARRTRSCRVIPSPSGSAKVRERSHSSASTALTSRSTSRSSSAVTTLAIDATPITSRCTASSSDSASRRISARTISGRSPWRTGDHSGSTPAASAARVSASGEPSAQSASSPARSGSSTPCAASSARDSRAAQRLQLELDRQALPAPLAPARLEAAGGPRSPRWSRPAAPAAPRGAGSRPAPPSARRSRSAPAGARPRGRPPGRRCRASGTGGRSRASTSTGVQPAASPRRWTWRSSVLLPIPPGPCISTTFAGGSSTKSESRKPSSRSRPTNAASSRRIIRAPRVTVSPPPAPRRLARYRRKMPATDEYQRMFPLRMPLQRRGRGGITRARREPACDPAPRSRAPRGPGSRRTARGAARRWARSARRSRPRPARAACAPARARRPG